VSLQKSGYLQLFTNGKNPLASRLGGCWIWGLEPVGAEVARHDSVDRVDAIWAVIHVQHLDRVGLVATLAESFTSVCWWSWLAVASVVVALDKPLVTRLAKTVDSYHFETPIRQPLAG
jgi:hypothetical protein